MPFRRIVALAIAASALAGGCAGSGHAQQAATTRPPPTPALTATTATTAPPASSSPVPSTTTTASTPTTAPPPAPAWKSCGDGFECATVTPPLDWDHPGAATARVAVIRLKASGPPSGRVG